MNALRYQRLFPMCAHIVFAMTLAGALIGVA